MPYGHVALLPHSLTVSVGIRNVILSSWSKPFGFHQPLETCPDCSRQQVFIPASRLVECCLTAPPVLVAHSLPARPIRPALRPPHSLPALSYSSTTNLGVRPQRHTRNHPSYLSTTICKTTSPPPVRLLQGSYRSSFCRT